VLALFLITVFSLSVAAAESLYFPWVYRPLAPYLNSELSFLASQLYGSERVNVYTMENKTVGSVGTLNGRFNQLNESLWSKPTVNVYILDQKLLPRVLNATDRKEQLGNELESRRLVVEPLTFGGKIRFSLAKLLVNHL
jgi:hypothetical protein